MKPEAAPDLTSGTSVGQYTIKRRIGSGGMGEVYEAVHTGLGKRVAIKTLRRAYAENEIVVTRFLREGQLASRIRHPHIVDATDVGMIDGLPCLVMEYLDGESLHAYFRREGALDVSRLADLMVPVLAAVEAAHAQGVVHRDLKPANIFLAQGWSGELTPKVLDFGISKVVQEAAPSDLTTDSTFLGSPHYVSPELARGDRDLDGRADQYSLGVILYEGSTGVRPFAQKADTFMGLMYAIAQGDFPAPHTHRPGLPIDFERIVLRAMARQKNDRFPNVAALGRALLPFASPRTRTIWEAQFGAMSSPVHPDVTVPDLQRVPYEETGGTLGQSASALRTGAEPAARPLGMAWWTLASVAAALVGLGVTFGASKLVSMAKNRDGGNDEVEVVEGLGVSSQSYTVSVKVKPEAASIELDRRVIGTGGFTSTFKSDGKTHKLVITAPGHVTHSIEFDATTKVPEQIVLQPLETEAPKPAKTGKPTAPRPAPVAPKPPPTATGAKGSGLKTDNVDPWAEK
ncbi:MAG: serine/threonine protein kinase [Myxococcales bacterium]|nr:serine/threonine protein kinase [Myxococcales bacterium]